MAKTSCSHWWHCPVYFTLSVTLAVIAISAATHHPKHNSSGQSDSHITHHLSFNASRALRKQGFTAIATLLQIYPEHFLTSPESTIFAIQDPAISNFSAHPKAMKHLLKYHTSPAKLPLQELLKLPQSSCLPTLVDGKNIAITKIGRDPETIEINNVMISHPDMFLEGPISIHGVVGPFSLLDPLIDQDWEVSQPTVCENASTSVTPKENEESINLGEWTRVVRFLSSNGFVSFGIGLNSVIDGIVQDHPEMGSVTIFAPLDFVFVASSWPLLDMLVRFHMVPRRFSYLELASLPERTTVKTLVHGRNLTITSGGSYSNRMLAMNGLEIQNPDIFLSKRVVIHGISRVFSMEELPLRKTL